MINRLTISLSPEESEGLQRIAERDVRPPKEQLRWILRQELIKRGLLEPAQDNDEDAQLAGSRALI